MKNGQTHHIGGIKLMASACRIGVCKAL